uniref:Putative secreted protein n=1 Tax=Anopheles triannulatus TaxID=58253 RepID=A0A2M4B6P8_9DIPT
MMARCRLTLALVFGSRGLRLTLADSLLPSSPARVLTMPPGPVSGEYCRRCYRSSLLFAKFGVILLGISSDGCRLLRIPRGAFAQLLGHGPVALQRCTRWRRCMARPRRPTSSDLVPVCAW